MQSDPGWSRFSALRCTVIINVIKNNKKKGGFGFNASVFRDKLY